MIQGSDKQVMISDDRIGIALQGPEWSLIRVLLQEKPSPLKAQIASFIPASISEGISLGLFFTKAQWAIILETLMEGEDGKDWELFSKVQELVYSVGR